MASQAKRELLRLGPLKGLDATTAGPYADPAYGSALANVDIRRNPGAASTARGRVNLTTLADSGQISALAEFAPNLGVRYLIAPLTSGEVYWWQPDANTQDLLANGQPFAQAVPYGASLFTSAGQQIALGSVPRAMAWQYAVADTGFAPTVAANAHGGIAMAQATYTYLFTVAIQLPTQTYALDEYGQETTPIGFSLPAGSAVAVYAYAVVVPDANTDILISANNGNTWSGTLADGSKWGVQIYRQSSNQPIFYLAYSAFWKTGDTWGALVNGTALEDSAADTVIAANRQIVYAQDQPPISVLNQGAVFAHKERLWVFTIVQNADTLQQPQCQLWYSAYGLPWLFDSANAAMLVGNDGTPDDSGADLYGDRPVAGISLASVGALHKSRTLWILYGDDQTTFVARKVGNYGCVSAGSVAVCQGIEYWLSEEGVFSFDGANAPQYLSQKIKSQLEAIPILDWQNSTGWFSDRTYYLSLPHITGTQSLQFPGRASGANSGNPTVTAGGSGRQSTAQPAKTASATISCVGVLHKPSPYPDTWYTTYTCTLGSTTAASWTSAASVAPTNTATQLAFTPTTISGSGSAILTLKNPSNVAVQIWTDIVQGIEYDWSDPAAATGTYTWIVTVDTSGEAGPGKPDDLSGTQMVTVTPATAVSVTGGSGGSTDGSRTVISTRSAVAPVDAGTQVALVLSSVVAPADLNGTTSFTVQLAGPDGTILQTTTAITAGTTLTYSDPAALAGVYTWTVWSTVASLSAGSETYACSAVLTLTWIENGTETTYSGGTTFAYHLPSQEWFTFPYATNAVASAPSENAPASAQQRLNAVFAARPGTLAIDAWEGAESDLGANVAALWTGPLTDGGFPGVRKSFETVVLNAPVQNGIATVTLAIDPGSITPPTKTFTWSVDLSKGPTAVWLTPNDTTRDNTGFLGQLSVSIQSDAAAQTPGMVYSVGVHGAATETLVPLDTGAVT